MPGTTASRTQRGFTLIELMIVVVVIAILAAVVVPSFMRETNKTKAETEVNSMFGEIGVKEEQYKIENHVYLSDATPAACPTATSSAGVDFAATCVTAGSVWSDLRIAPPDAKVRCTYLITAGLSTDVPSPPAGFTMTAPATGWWWAVATCDSDNQSGTNATFFVSSVDTKIQKQNEGQ